VPANAARKLPQPPGGRMARRGAAPELNTKALTTSRRGDLALTLEYRREALEDVRELVRGEQACCAFLDFRLDERADNLVLTITAPEAARDAADMLFEQFEARGTPAEVFACGCTSGCQA
jgi:hypothetical protein